MREEGLITLVSRRSVGNTVDALAAAVTAHGMAIYGRIDFAVHAASSGATLRPTELLLFGNPGVAVPLLDGNQMAGIDLPMRALVWEDENGEVWLTYPDADWLVERYGLGPEVAVDIAAIRKAMAAVVSTAAAA